MSGASDTTLISTTTPSDELQKNTSDTPLPLLSVLSFPVVISILNYVTLAFLNISVNALLPLFFHMPVAMGGLNLDPVVIGYIMSLYGAGSGVFQMAFFTKLVKGYGVRKTFVISVATFGPVFLAFPLMSLVAKNWSVNFVVWTLLGIVLVLLFLMDTAYGMSPRHS